MQKELQNCEIVISVIGTAQEEVLSSEDQAKLSEKMDELSKKFYDGIEKEEDGETDANDQI